MTMRSIEAKYEYADDLREDAEEQQMATHVTDMMNEIEDVLSGNEYIDVYFVLAMLLVSAAREENEDPAHVYATVSMHISAACAALMGQYDNTVH